MNSKQSEQLSLQTLEDHMVFVEGGGFEMGGSKFEDEKPIHSVVLRSFYLCRYAVSQSLWEEVMESNPSEFVHPLRPVERVSWYDAVEFCNKLSELKGLIPYYKINKEQEDPHNESEDDKQKWIVSINATANGYRLPTEAEWEYAARGGKYARELEYAGSDNLKEVGWSNANSHRISQPNGFKCPNSLGLYDVSGNVDEWCWDRYGEDYYEKCEQEGKVKNPLGPKKGSYRVVRGGSWFDVNVNFFRVAGRGFSQADFRNVNLGFRLSRY